MGDWEETAPACFAGRLPGPDLNQDQTINKHPHPKDQATLGDLARPGHKARRINMIIINIIIIFVFYSSTVVAVSSPVDGARPAASGASEVLGPKWPPGGSHRLLRWR